jgi:hypothetical protein
MNLDPSRFGFEEKLFNFWIKDDIAIINNGYSKYDGEIYTMFRIPSVLKLLETSTNKDTSDDYTAIKNYGCVLLKKIVSILFLQVV